MKNERDVNNALWFMWGLGSLAPLAVAVAIFALKDRSDPSPFGEGGSGAVVSAPMPPDGEVASAYSYTFPRVPDVASGNKIVTSYEEKVEWKPQTGPRVIRDEELVFKGSIVRTEAPSWVTDSSLTVSAYVPGPEKLALQCGIEINLKTGAVHIPADLTLDEASRKFWENLTAAFPGVR